MKIILFWFTFNCLYIKLNGPHWTHADLSGRTTPTAATAYHQTHHRPPQHQQFAYESGQEHGLELTAGVRGEHTTLSAITIHQDQDEEGSSTGGTGSKFKRLCYGSTADANNADLENQSKESANSTFVIPLPMTTTVTPGSSQRPVIQFQHHLSPPRAGHSPSHQSSPSSSSSSSSSQNSRRDHNIDYSTLFVQLSGTFPTLYRCVNCHKTVSNRWHHANIHRPQSHACPICGQKFTRRDNMKAHCKIKHADMRTSPSGGPPSLSLNNGDQGYFTHFVQMW